MSINISSVIEIAGTMAFAISGSFSAMQKRLDVFGVLIMYNPLKQATGITLFIGSFAVLLGIIYLLDSFRYRKTETSIDLMY